MEMEIEHYIMDVKIGVDWVADGNGDSKRMHISSFRIA